MQKNKEQTNGSLLFIYLLNCPKWWAIRDHIRTALDKSNAE